MTLAAVVGSRGQDGRILCEQLRRDGIAALGISRESIDGNGVFDGEKMNVADAAAVSCFVAQWRPDAVFYLAAHHHSSQDNLASDPLTLFNKSYEVHVAGLFNFLEAIRTELPRTRLFYAASSLVFGEPAAETHSVGEFAAAAFGALGLDWRRHVEEDPRLLGRRKPAIRGDAAKLRARTGWQPSVTFEQMVRTLLLESADPTPSIHEPLSNP